MKRLFILFVVVSAAITLALVIGNAKHQAYSFGLGTVFIGLNLALWAWVWRQIIAKKTIALAVSVIVFKYAFFILFMLRVVGSGALHTSWFALGIANLAFVAMIWSFWEARITKKG